MKLGVRSKLFLISVLLIVLSVGVAGFVLVGDLRTELERRVEAELERHARSTLTTLKQLTATSSRAEFDSVADAIGQASGLRVTIINRTGVVVGDSEIGLDDVSSMENHALRPEIARARDRGRGSARRYSTTVATEMLYVAVGSPEGLTVRVAKPLREVEESISVLRGRLFAAALVGLFIAVLMSALASHWMTRVIRELAHKARAIATSADVHKVDESDRGSAPQKDELGRLAGSLDRLAKQIEGTVSELAEERSRFATVLESMDEGVIALDEKQTITLINPTAIKLLGLANDPIGGRLSDAIRAPSLVELVLNVPEEGKNTVEVELPRSRRLLARATRPASGRGSVIVLHDITEVSRLESVRRDFVANVSHELRTPVSIISANAETLLEAGTVKDEGTTKLLSAVHRNSIRMGNLIADLLDLSRLEAGRYNLELEPISVEKSVSAAIAVVEQKAEQNETVISVEVESEIVAVADRKALDQVLVNLLENAIKYTPTAGRVIVRGATRGSIVRLVVEDDGPGIAPDQRARVFERFYRLDAGRSRDTGGTGLGLSIVRHLVENMNGDVGVTNTAGTGSLFWIELPAG